MDDSIESMGSEGFKNQPEQLDIYQYYLNSPYLSIKHSSYFQVYSDIFEKFRGTEIIFVEIGVLNGGSLFMWRDYFGNKARIIGIDLNPDAKRWESAGFEIHIGNQSDPVFWQHFFETIGSVDIVLDDGGHTYEQQIVTAHCCIPNVRDGGMLVIEDTHTSYFIDFGYPSQFTFIEWVKTIFDNINNRFPSLETSTQRYKDHVYSVRCFESIVCMEIDRRKCQPSHATRNLGKSLHAVDFRYEGTHSYMLHRVRLELSRKLGVLKRFKLARAWSRHIFNLGHNLLARYNSRRVKKYFE